MNRANIIDGDEHFAVEPIGEQQWSEIYLPETTTGRPDRVFDDYAWPLSTLRFYPVPDGAYTLELFPWGRLVGAATLATEVSYPDGYELAIVTNLAIHLCNLFKMPVDADLRAQARESLGNIRRLNLPRPTMTTDLPWVNCGREYNVLTNE